jgi:hypothetical protein
MLGKDVQIKKKIKKAFDVYSLRNEDKSVSSLSSYIEDLRAYLRRLE